MPLTMQTFEVKVQYMPAGRSEPQEVTRRVQGYDAEYAMQEVIDATWDAGDEPLEVTVANVGNHVRWTNSRW